MSMSVLSRGLVAALICTAGVQALPSAAMAQPAAAGDPNTFHQFQHASKCVVTLGFGGDCDQNAPVKRDRTKPTPVSGPAEIPSDPGHQFLHTGECVVTLGFLGHCDKDPPAPKVEKTAAQVAADDASTRHQFLHTGKCVVTFGFGGNCEKK